MSQRQLLDTLKAAVLDTDTGLKAQADTIALAESIEVVTDFALDRWMLSGVMHSAAQHNVSIAPKQWAANTMLPNENLRDAVGIFTISFETFSPDPAVLEDTISVFTTALIRVLDRLREFSDAHAGTVVQVMESVSFAFGAFAGGTAASSGFICTVSIQERSNE
jgi:hypothetical protein